MIGWTDIPKEQIGDLLREFRAHPMNHQFQGEPLADFLLETTEERLSQWEVRIPSGSGPDMVLLGERVSVRPRVRRVVVADGDKDHHRLGVIVPRRVAR